MKLASSLDLYENALADKTRRVKLRRSGVAVGAVAATVLAGAVARRLKKREQNAA